jgi:hypothetical protein
MYLQSESQFDANICLCKGTVVWEYLSTKECNRANVCAVMRIFVLGSVVMRMFICTRVCSNANICVGGCSNANIRARECNNANIFAAIRACLLREGKFACSFFFSFCLKYNMSKITIQSYSKHIFSFR